MVEKNKTPTTAQFEAFENAYEYFNEKLFKNELPPVLLNLSRKSKAMGFVAPFRWRKAGDEIGKGSVHELSINPEILSMSFVEVYSTLVHEQCHIWQHEKGNPSRSGYHNKEWANKMVGIGLIPSDTGFKGGNMTGQNMNDYPEEGGVFLKALEEMPFNYKLPFTSIEGDFHAMYLCMNTEGASVAEHISIAVQNGDTDSMSVDSPKLSKPKSSKNKYSCPCGFNIWAKVGLHVICGDCENAFELAI